MKLGVCTGFENIEKAAAVGFSFVECNLSQLAAMNDEEFEKLQGRAAAFPIPVLRCNGFMPGEIKVTGPLRDEQQLRGYLDKALQRASAVGVKVAVFGSGVARAVPEGWDYYKAFEEFADFLRLAGEYGEKYDVSIAVEPLRREETNIVNLVSEAMILSSWVDSPRVGVLADTYHLLSSHEPWSVLEKAGSRLMHVHISGPLPDLSSRVYPAPGDGNDYESIFEVLNQMEYQGLVSVEAGTEDLEKDGTACLACLGRYFV